MHGVLDMLYFGDVVVDTKDLSLDELWDLWEKEAETAAGLTR
jgi:hypothetical protein